jgi:hypothetical protein
MVFCMTRQLADIKHTLRRLSLLTAFVMPALLSGCGVGALQLLWVKHQGCTSYGHKSSQAAYFTQDGLVFVVYVHPALPPFQIGS